MRRGGRTTARRGLKGHPRSRTAPARPAPTPQCRYLLPDPYHRRPAAARAERGNRRVGLDARPRCRPPSPVLTGRHWPRPGAGPSGNGPCRSRSGRRPDPALRQGQVCRARPGCRPVSAADALPDSENVHMVHDKSRLSAVLPLFRYSAAAVAVGRVGLGVAALVSPSVPARPWVGSSADELGAQVFGRALGARDLALGLGALAAARNASVRFPVGRRMVRRRGAVRCPGRGGNRGGVAAAATGVPGGWSPRPRAARRSRAPQGRLPPSWSDLAGRWRPGAGTPRASLISFEKIFRRAVPTARHQPPTTFSVPGARHLLQQPPVGLRHGLAQRVSSRTYALLSGQIAAVGGARNVIVGTLRPPAVTKYPRSQLHTLQGYVARTPGGPCYRRKCYSSRSKRGWRLPH